MGYLKTTAAARKLGCSYYRLLYLLRTGKLDVAKDSSGDFIWSDFDLQKARDLLASMLERRSGRQAAVGVPPG
jgi:hypothetical protein